MKEVELHIDDKLYKELKNQIQVKALVGGFHGLSDSFVALLIREIDKGNKTIFLEKK